MSKRSHRGHPVVLAMALLACGGAAGSAVVSAQEPAARSPRPSSAEEAAAPAATPRDAGPVAGGSPPLRLADAVARALDAAPPVSAARAAEAAARGQLAEAEADLAPVLSLGGSAFRYQKPTIVSPIHGFTPGLLPSFDRTVFLGDAQVRYELWDGGARSARIAQRRAQLAAAQSAAAAVVASTGARAVATYVTVLTLDEQLAAHSERNVALDAEHRRVAQLLAVGRAADVDLLRVRAAEASAEAERVSLAANRESAARELLRLMGDDPQARDLPALAPATLGVEEPLLRAALLDRARAASPEIARARRDLEAAESAVTAARAGRAPALRLEGHLLGFAGGEGDASGEWNAGVRVAVPLWDRHVAARVALAEAGRDAAAAAVRLADDAVAGALDRSWAELAGARARASSLAEAEARWAEVVRIEKLRLGVGAGVEADYLRAEADLFAARAAAVEAKNQIAAARAELARATGELSAAWVEDLFADATPANAATTEDGRR